MSTFTTCHICGSGYICPVCDADVPPSVAVPEQRLPSQEEFWPGWEEAKARFEQLARDASFGAARLINDDCIQICEEFQRKAKEAAGGGS